STIGLRGSPENNSLIRYLAQQRSNRQKAAFTEISPFKHSNVRPLKDKIEVFQTSFESLQEAEEKTELSGLSHNKIPLKKEPAPEQWSERFTLDNSGADWKENVSASVSKSSKSDPRTCSILSPQRGVTEPAAPKEWVYKQYNLTESLETVVTGDILETGHGKRIHH
ncbi:CDCA2 protein, partial [Grallaria varia]|nr:CDCA2 protein [Grallaria varia]